MHVGSGLGFMSLPDIAGPAFLPSLLQATKRLARLTKDKLHIPAHPDVPDPVPHDFHSLYTKLLSLTFENEHLLDEGPGLKLQHTLVEQNKSARFQEVYNSLSDTHNTCHGLAHSHPNYSGTRGL